MQYLYIFCNLNPLVIHFLQVIPLAAVAMVKVDTKKKAPPAPAVILSPEDDPAFKAALAKQKALLAAQGRSNKRTKKEDA